MKIKLENLQTKIMGIYKINYTNGKIYIGQSVDIKRRIYEHNHTKRLKNHFQSPCDLAILTYGKIEEIEILDLCQTQEQLDEKEKYWIKYYNSTNKKIGYNLTSGGKDGSALYGEQSPGAVFTNAEVLDIRKRRFFGERKKDVYQDYKKYNFSTFEHIWLGRGYPQIGTEYLIETNSKTRQEYSSKANSGENNNKAKLTEKDVKMIRKRFDNGESPISIQKDYNCVNVNSIRRVCKRETWKNIL